MEKAEKSSNATSKVCGTERCNKPNRVTVKAKMLL